jgi:hypothetical protein
MLEHKIHLQKKNGLHRLLLIPSEPWEIISMDFMTQPPKWNKMGAISIVFNQFSKLVKMVPTKTITR